MKTYHWNGEYWYRRNWGLFQRIRTWIIWIGGWEGVNGTGWKIFEKTRKGWRICDPTPLSLFGHRFTQFRYGWHLKWRGAWLVYHKYPEDKPTMYLSTNGTTSRATVWYLNAPTEVIRAADEHEADSRIRAIRENRITGEDG